LDAEFLDFVDRMEQVLDAILDRFETSYFEVFDRLVVAPVSSSGVMA
jgi:hypothetical protein